MSQPRLTYHPMPPCATAFSTTRHGGASQGDYAQMNINRYCGDSPEAVAANHRALCAVLGIAPNRLIYPHQTHQTTIRPITTDFLSMADTEREAYMEGVDGLMTHLPGVCIGVSTADCIPVFLCDTRQEAVAVVHAGWRGTVAAIAGKAVAAMQHTYGTQPADLCAVIGPGISRQHFEVGMEVYEAFAAAGFDMQRVAYYPTPTAKPHLDLPLCNELTLLQAGLHPENIHQSAICTYSQHADYFSARRLGINSGRIFNGISLNGRHPTATIE